MTFEMEFHCCRSWLVRFSDVRDGDVAVVTCPYCGGMLRLTFSVRRWRGRVSLEGI